MKKREIFETIVKIMQEDSSSYKDVKGDNPKEYVDQITEDMPAEDFVYIVNSYLSTFGLTGHLSFRMEGMAGALFEVQRYGDSLFITDVSKGCSLRVGDEIIAIDNMSVADYAKMHEKFLFDEINERQSPHWRQLLKYAKNIKYIDAVDGGIKEYTIEHGEYQQEQKYVCKKMNEEIALLRLCDFSDEEAIQKLYQENDELLSGSKYLIIDVRNNGGGSDTAFLPLLKYCLPKGKSFDEIFIDNGIQKDGAEINYSERNCSSRMELINEYLQMELPKETREIIDDMKKDLENKYGQGFISEEDEDLEIPIVGESQVEHTYIITDGGCASTGDNFVYIFGKLPNVTVVGRPTMGILDYSNVTIAEFDEYKLVYPTSRLLSLNRGEGMMHKGVAVDEYVEWTTNHLKEDVDMRIVLNLINN